MEIPGVLAAAHTNAIERPVKNGFSVCFIAPPVPRNVNRC